MIIQQIMKKFNYLSSSVASIFIVDVVSSQYFLQIRDNYVTPGPHGFWMGFTVVE